MATVRVLPNSNRLRQLIRDHGEKDWRVISPCPWLMPCFKGDIGITIQKGHHVRNIRLDDCVPTIEF